MTNELETRKIHISVPKYVYEYLRTNKKFSTIDGVITKLLIEYYDINNEK